MENSNDRLLTKNKIELFLLRFDIVKDISLDYKKIIDDISIYFDRTEKRSEMAFKINFTTDKMEGNKIDNPNYYLTNDKYKYSVTFSKTENSFWFETSNYINRESYLKIITCIMDSFKKNDINLKTRRIGMRFINKFVCLDKIHISKVFNSEIARNLKQRCLQENLSRLINVDEFNFDACKVRVQYGIPNKFYPAVLNNFDLLLDIDAYNDSVQELDNILSTVKLLNHCAYNMFVAKINSKLIEGLK